jgi:hypothetical protein
MTLSDVLSRLEWTASAFVAEARATWGMEIQKDKKT